MKDTPSNRTKTIWSLVFNIGVKEMPITNHVTLNKVAGMQILLKLRGIFTLSLNLRGYSHPLLKNQRVFSPFPTKCKGERSLWKFYAKTSNWKNTLFYLVFKMIVFEHHSFILWLYCITRCFKWKCNKINSNKSYDMCFYKIKVSYSYLLHLAV